MRLIIGTRGSRLALAQADKVCRMLAEKGVQTERKIIRTEGDTNTTAPLHEIGGQGLFVRALDDAILRGEIDAAVHSLKDVPAIRPHGVVTSAVLPRDSPADFLAHEKPIREVRVIGTSSTRRKAQLLRQDPSHIVKGLRGNVDTRLRKLVAGEYDAIVIAEAGLERLSIQLPGERLPVESFVPAPNQGTIVVVSRDDPSLTETLSLLDDPVTRSDVAIERAVMEEVGGGCFTPLGIYCKAGHLVISALSLDGLREIRREEDVDTLAEARNIGKEFRAEAWDLIDEAYRTLGIEPMKDKKGGDV